MSNWKFNRSEWSEAYVFLRLLGIGRIYGMDENWQKNHHVYLDIVNVLRSEVNRVLKFQRTKFGECPCSIEISENDIEISMRASEEFNRFADILYDNIKSANTTTFEVPQAENFLKNNGIISPKANLSDDFKNMYGKKSDIVFTAAESISGFKSTTGYSIKSHFGKPPTLYNASKGSGFIFRLLNCNDDSIMHKINATKELRKKITYMKQNCIELEYVNTKSVELRENLQFIDTNMDKILSSMLLLRYGYYDIIPESSRLSDIVPSLAIINPLNISRRNSFYFYKAKLKELLFDSFAGMTAVKPWNGEREINGGYIDVDQEGQILFCRAISDNSFMSYLYEHTYVTEPGSGVNKAIAFAKAKAVLAGRDFTEDDLRAIAIDSKGKTKPVKGDYGYVYKFGNEYRFDMNFQIRIN